MSNEEKSYIAGFLDGDGCIMAQLVRRKDYIFGYQIRVSIVFYQRENHNEILYWIKKKLKYGYIRQRNDDMTEYTIVGLKVVYEVLKTLYPYLRLKKQLAKLVMRLIGMIPKKMSPKLLLKLSLIVDQTAKFNYSKKRTNTSKTIVDFLERHNLFPVETDPLKGEID